MKKIYLLLLVTLLIKSSYAQVNNYENGDTINDFVVVDVYGNTHNLYSYTAEGKYVFLDFFYSACGGCQNFIAVFNEFYDKYGCNEGEIVCLAINSGYDKDLEVIAFENTYGGTFNHAPAISVDGGCEAVDIDFDPIYYPACVLIGPDNTMVNNNIYPIDTVTDIEAAFPIDFYPQAQNCSLGINEFTDAFYFNIFPNPLDGSRLILKRNWVTKSTITIFNMVGESVFFDEINNSQKTIYPNLIAGIYLVMLQTSKGQFTQKLIVN